MTTPAGRTMRPGRRHPRTSIAAPDYFGGLSGLLLVFEELLSVGVLEVVLLLLLGELRLPLLPLVPLLPLLDGLLMPLLEPLEVSVPVDPLLGVFELGVFP
jgi:hypothetical protein